MTPEAQRIAIAEACGWIRLTSGRWFSPEQQAQIELREFSPSVKECPDYLNDLNAMHEAEKVIHDEERSIVWAEYLDHLARITKSDCTFAIAAQRAEAFLRTLGLWSS